MFLGLATVVSVMSQSCEYTVADQSDINALCFEKDTEAKKMSLTT